LVNLLADVRQALRMFAKNPGFTLAVIAALALGIGADTAIFSVVNAVLLKPLTYPEPDRIAQFLNTSPQGQGPGASATKFHVWQEQASVFQDVAAYDFSGKGLNLTGAVPEQLHGVHVTEAYFRLFGARMLLGRTFTPQEDAPHGGNVLVMSHGLWKRKRNGLGPSGASERIHDRHPKTSDSTARAYCRVFHRRRLESFASAHAQHWHPLHAELPFDGEERSRGGL